MCKATTLGTGWIDMGILMYCRRLDSRNNAKTVCDTDRAPDCLISVGSTAKDVTLIQDMTYAGVCVLVLSIVSRLII
jgi:hypothetical protein